MHKSFLPRRQPVLPIRKQPAAERTLGAQVPCWHFGKLQLKNLSPPDENNLVLPEPIFPSPLYLQSLFQFSPLRRHGGVFEWIRSAPKPTSLLGSTQMRSLEHGGCVCVWAPSAQRAAAGWTACEGWAEGPLPNAVPLIHLNADLEKLPFMGRDEVWIQSPSSLGSCHFLHGVQLCQTTSTGPAEGRRDWQGPLGKADIKRPCKLISGIGLSLTIIVLFFLAVIKPAKVGAGSVTSPVQLNDTFSVEQKGCSSEMRLWKVLCSFPFLLKCFGSWPKPAHFNLTLNVPKGEKGEHAFCHFACAQRIKCSRFNFIKSLTTGADTEDGKYARPENSQNPTVSISIKARCSTGCSNLIKLTNNKGFSPGSAGPWVHSSVQYLVSLAVHKARR